MQLIQVIEELFRKPPIPYMPAKHSLKAWATFCLRDRGFKVIYAQEADFAIEPRGGEKIYFKVTDDESEASPKIRLSLYSSKFSKIIEIDRA
jgi:hypothetical protein